MIRLDVTNPRSLTLKKPNNSNIYLPGNPATNITSNNCNLVLSTSPNIINEEKSRVSSSIHKENDNLKKLVNFNSRKRDAETQTEDIFFKM